MNFFQIKRFDKKLSFLPDWQTNIFMNQFSLFFEFKYFRGQSTQQNNYPLPGRLEKWSNFIIKVFDYCLFVKQTVDQRHQPILMPLLLIQNENNQFDTIIPLFTNASIISLPNITLALSPIQSEYRSAIFLISACTDKFNLGQTCAKQDEIDKYVNSFNQFINIDVNLTYFNQHTDKLEQITKDTVIGISHNQTLFQSINLRTTFHTHDKGWLLESNQYNTFVENVEQVSQVINRELTQQVLNDHDPIFLTLIRIGEIQTITKIVNTKISEILAQIGSIASLLMSINILASFYNTHMLENQLLDEILTHLFPKLRSLFMTRNIFGSIDHVFFKGKVVDKEEFFPKYKQAKKMAEDYLTISNLIKRIIIIERTLRIQEDLRNFDKGPSNQMGNQVREQEQQTFVLNQEGSSEISLIFSI